MVVSPLSGIQQGQLNNGADNYFLSRTQLRRLQGGDRFERLDDQTLQQMRREVQQGTDQQAQQQNPNELNNAVRPPLEAPNNKPLDASVGSTASVAPSSLNNAVRTQEGMYRTLSNVAAQQTPVLDDSTSVWLYTSSTPRPMSNGNRHTRRQSQPNDQGSSRGNPGR